MNYPQHEYIQWIPMIDWVSGWYFILRVKGSRGFIKCRTSSPWCECGPWRSRAMIPPVTEGVGDTSVKNHGVRRHFPLNSALLCDFGSICSNKHPKSSGRWQKSRTWWNINLPVILKIRIQLSAIVLCSRKLRKVWNTQRKHTWFWFPIICLYSDIPSGNQK